MATILEVIISVVVIYLIFATVVNIVVEFISGQAKLRAKLLKKAVLHLFPDASFGLDVYNHPRIKSLKTPDKKDPSYIPASSISAAIVDLISSKAGENGADTLQKFKIGVNSLDQSDLKSLLSTFSQSATDIKTLSETIEKWFDNSMDRVTGWFKRETRTMLILVSLAVTLIFNIDTIYIFRQAQVDPVLRQKLNDLGDRLLADSTFIQAGQSESTDIDYYDEYVNDSSVVASDSVIMETQNQSGPIGADVDQRVDQLIYVAKLIRESDLPIGWGRKMDDWLFIILGWALTAFALSAGAPFWFDVLKKAVNIRSSGPKPASTIKSEA